MHLSLFSDYSLRVLMFASSRGSAFSITEVSTAFGISRNHLVKVVNHLARLGYLETRRGRGGGITLGRPAAEIRLGAVVRETEGGQLLVECFDPATNTCAISGHCGLKRVLAEAERAFFSVLDQHTLADIASGSRARAILKSLLPLSA